MPLAKRYLLRETPHPTGVVVFPTRRAIWLKAGRTAGTAIWRHGIDEQVPWICPGRSYQPREYQEWITAITDAELAEWTVFTVVRNPYDRVLSALKYLHVDIEYFGANPLAAVGNDALRLHLMCQHWYYVPANYVGRYEFLTHAWDEIARILDISPRQLPRINSSEEHGHYRDELSPRVRQLIEVIYQRELRDLEYEW